MDTILEKIGRIFHNSGKNYTVLQFKMFPEDIFLQKFTTVLIIHQFKDIIPFLIISKIIVSCFLKKRSTIKQLGNIERKIVLKVFHPKEFKFHIKIQI